jgi:hypothetical protein
MAWFWGVGFLPRLLYGCMPKAMCFDRSVEGLVGFCLDWLLYAPLLLYAFLQVGLAFAVWRFRDKHTELAAKVAEKGKVCLCCMLATWQLIVPFFVPVPWEYACVAWAVYSLLMLCCPGAFAVHLHVLYWEVIAVNRGLRVFWPAHHAEEELLRIIYQRANHLNQEEIAVKQQFKVSFSNIKHNRPGHAVRHDYIELLQWYIRVDVLITHQSNRIKRIREQIANQNQQNPNSDTTDLQTELDAATDAESVYRNTKPNLYTLGFVKYTVPWRLAPVIFVWFVRLLAWGWSWWAQVCMTQRNAADYQKYLESTRRA